MQDNYSLKRKSDLVEVDPAFITSTDSGFDSEYYGDSSSATGSDQKQQLYKFLAGIKKHWLIILAINLLVTALVIVYEAQKPEYYQAETRIQVNNEVNPAAGAAGSSIIMASSGVDPAYFTTQLQILEGPGLLRRVVKSIDLENNQAFLRPSQAQKFTVWQNVMRMFGMYKPTDNNQVTIASAEKTPNKNLTLNNDTPLDADKEVENLAPYVSYLKRSLKVVPVKDNRTSSKETRLIELEFTHNDPATAAKIVNAIANTYVLQNLEQKVETNAAAGDFLQKRVAELQSLIRSGEERLINYGKSNQILSLDSNQNTVVQRFSDLSGKLGAAENERLIAETAYRATLQNPVAKITAENKDGRTAGFESQLIALRQRLDELKTEYTEEWWEVVQVRRQIGIIEKELQTYRKRASDTQLATLEQTYREALAREKELRNNFEKQRAEVLAQNEAAINYRIIQQEIDTNKKLLDGILQRSRETDIILNDTPNNVRIVDPALVPRSPAGPNRSKNIVVAFMASLLMGLGLSVLLTWLNDTITPSDNLEAQTGLPVLSIIPATELSFANRLKPTRLLKSSKRKGQDTYDQESFKKPIFAESYLQLRTHLLFSTAGGPPQTILITSGQPGEGKTITALNLAKTLAQTGAKVLLIDADLRYPRMHTAGNISNSRGLSNLLTTKEVSQDTIVEIIQKNIEDNLDILTAGPNSPNPANILGSSEMRGLLANLKKQYTHIIIDSPPVLLFADSSILSTFVDAVMLVARCNLTSMQNILQAKKKLQDVHAKIVGVVFNGVPLKASKYYGYGYYEQLETTSSSDRKFLNLN